MTAGQARQYGFDERLAMSQGISVSASIRDVLLQAIPGAYDARPSGQANDKNGVDWWVEVPGRHLGVDVKVREEDWAAKPHPLKADDLALETFSVLEKQVIGWTRDSSKRTDYVLWFWKDTGRWCLLPFPMLCAVFAEKWQEWKTIYKVAPQRTVWQNGRNYHSECVFVPRQKVWDEIGRRYAGAPKDPA